MNSNLLDVSLGIVLASAAASCATFGADRDWAEFRGPGGLGISSAKGLPITWSEKENLIWKAALPGSGTSSPVAWGERIFLTCHTGYGAASAEAGDMKDLQLHVLCLNREDGRILWNKSVAPELPEQERIRENHGYSSGTPAADAQRIYVSFGKSGVVAFEHDGRELWRTKIGSKIHGWGSSPSPVLHKELVIVNASVESESLVALNKQTGQEVWRTGGIVESWNRPLLVNVAGGHTELVVGIVKKLLAFDPDNGQPLWNCDSAINWYICPSAVAHEGVVYSIGGRTGGSLAVRAGGRGNVTGSHLLWKLNKGSNVSSPIYHDGHLYFAHENLGILYCVNARTGELVYEERLSPSPGQFYPSPVLADGKLYYVSRSGRTVVVAAQPKFEQLAYNLLPSDRSAFNASPAVIGNRLLLRSDRFLYCIGEK